MNAIGEKTARVRAWLAENQKEQPVGYTGIFRHRPTFSSKQLQEHDRPGNGWALDYQTRKIYCIAPLFLPNLLPHPFLQDSKAFRQQFEHRLGGHKDVHEDIDHHRFSTAQQLISVLCIGELAPGEPLPAPRIPQSESEEP